MKRFLETKENGGNRKSRNSGFSLNSHTKHYLSLSYEMYPCDCSAMRSRSCNKCLLSSQARIAQIKSKLGY
jgi:uncharacterized membrane protein